VRRGVPASRLKLAIAVCFRIDSNPTRAREFVSDMLELRSSEEILLVSTRHPGRLDRHNGECRSMKRSIIATAPAAVRRSGPETNAPRRWLCIRARLQSRRKRLKRIAGLSPGGTLLRCAFLAPFSNSPERTKRATASHQRKEKQDCPKVARNPVGATPRLGNLRHADVLGLFLRLACNGAKQHFRRDAILGIQFGQTADIQITTGIPVQEN
jgi:hypothetical protein